ncbi:hypothetical protein [Blautia obeum]|nr:hypothetical protein [Blautia obeum]
MIGVIGGRILLLTITGVAVLMDLYQMKIKKQLDPFFDADRVRI